MSEYRFNPCFNGCSTATSNLLLSEGIRGSFNPCFNGCSTATVW